MKTIPWICLALGIALEARGAALPRETISAAESIRRSAGADRDAMRILRSLTDHVGARLAGSAGSRAAVAWAVEELKSLGFENIHTEPLLEPRWERGVEQADIVAPAIQRLAVTALGGSAPTPDAGLTREVVATENVETLKRLLEADPGAVRDRFVFFRQRMERTADGSGYGHAVGIRWNGPGEAAKAGAAGALIRSVGTSSSRLPHTGTMKIDPSVPTIPSAALSGPDADLLERLVAERTPVRLHLALGCRTLPDVPGANVIGEIRGSEKPDEIVLLGAHLDSWDLGTGAIDDGAGVAIVTRAARLIAELPRRPRRTIRVVLFANEENGDRGSRAYVQAHRAEMDLHVAGIEMDLGADRVRSVGFSAGPGTAGLQAALAGLLQPIGVAPASSPASGGVDVGPLRAFGVPVVDLNQDASRYFDFHHSADDTYDKVDPANLAQALSATATVALALADAPDTLGRLAEADRRIEKW